MNISTVTVVLEVFAGVQIDVTLDRALADTVTPPNPMTVYVFNDVAPGTHTLEIKDVAGNSVIREITGYETVDGLFDLIQEGIDQNAYQITDEFDVELGYPTSAYVDYGQLIADQELGFSVGSLTESE